MSKSLRNLVGSILTIVVVTGIVATTWTLAHRLSASAEMPTKSKSVVSARGSVTSVSSASSNNEVEVIFAPQPRIHNNK